MATRGRRTGQLTLSVDAARRLALAAQGFATPRPTGRITRRHLHWVFDRIGLIQIDSVNVLVRTQELPLFSRLGPHPRTLIPDALDDGELFEYWCHAASLIPASRHHLSRFRMELAARRLAETQQGRWFKIRESGLLDTVLQQVRERGPLAVGDLEGRVRNKGSWWDWDDTKIAVEALFELGVVGATRRRNDFARLYDVIERILPADVLATPPTPEREARKESLLLAARSLGVATLTDLADYYRLNAITSKPIVAELVDDGALLPVTVEGWDKPAFIDPQATTPRAVTGRALLSPFDSLIWNRERTQRLFDFNYRLEIYVPEPKRVFGYYVLPFLLDGQLAARVDLKADRAAGVLRVQAAHVEADLDDPLERPRIAGELAVELKEMAHWLGLSGVGTTGRGNLAGDLVAAGVDAVDPVSASRGRGGS